MSQETEENQNTELMDNNKPYISVQQVGNDKTVNFPVTYSLNNIS